MHKIGGIDMETVKEMELSNLAMEWLVRHNLQNRAKNVKECHNVIEFTLPLPDDNRRVEFNTVCLSNGYWETHPVWKNKLKF
jgi:hypothetical protein